MGAISTFMFNWKALVVSIVLWWISASLGVDGVHRLRHITWYKTPNSGGIFYYLLRRARPGRRPYFFGHMRHHATDVPGDPHTRDGGWWSHWLDVAASAQYSPEVIARYAPDLIKDISCRSINLLAADSFLAVALLVLAWSHMYVGHFFPRDFQSTCYLAG